MCGIVGLLSLNKIGFTQDHVTIFEQMLYADQLRGHHGTGMFWDNKNKDVDFIRGAMNASEFLNDLGVKKSLSSIYNEASFVVGHNRWATRGGHTNENTHPFTEKNITLVHNGTLFGHKKLKDVEVDSHAICHSFAEKGHEETIKEIDGAFALVWYDNNDKILRFARNSQRPLHIIRGRSLVALASEPKLAEWIFARNKEEVIKVESCEVGTLYEFNRETREITSHKVSLRPPTVQQEYPKSHYPQTYNREYSHGHWSGSKWIPYGHAPNYNEEEDTRIALPAPKKEWNKSNIITFPNYKNGDKVLFTPLAIDKSGNGYKLSLIVQSKIDDPDIYAIYYSNNKVWLSTLMLYHTVEATVQALRQKHGEISLVVKDPSPQGEMDDDNSCNLEDLQQAFDNGEIPTITGVVH